MRTLSAGVEAGSTLGPVALVIPLPIASAYPSRWTSAATFPTTSPVSPTPWDTGTLARPSTTYSVSRRSSTPSVTPSPTSSSASCCSRSASRTASSCPAGTFATSSWIPAGTSSPGSSGTGSDVTSLRLRPTDRGLASRSQVSDTQFERRS